MADSSVIAASPLPDRPFAGRDVTIAPASPRARFVLRARDPARLSALIGRSLPASIGAVQAGIAMLGPDEYLALLDPGEALPAGAGEPVSVVDVSARSVGLVVEGARAAETIMAGCPLDLDRMAPGRATRTLFETVEIVIWRESPTRFHIEVWCSFAPWLWLALVEAAAE